MRRYQYRTTGRSPRISEAVLRWFTLMALSGSKPRSGNNGRRGPRNASQGRETLAAILSRAGELASLEGLEQLSMGRLASAVGITKSGLYAHFSSKEELQLATIAHTVQVFALEVVREAPEEDPDCTLGALLDRWLAFFEQKVFPGGCFLIVSAVEFAQRPGPVREALEAALDQELAALEAAIRRAKKTRELRATMDARQTAFELHCILMNAHALFQVKDDPAVFKRARTAIRRLIQ